MTGLHHGYDRYDNRGHADFVHGGVPIDDFEPEFKHRKKTKYEKKKRGCSGNDFKEHVYIWADWWSWWGKQYEREICIGCEQRKPGGKMREKA